MIKEMIVSSNSLETKVAILEDDELAELYIERNRNRGILANTYKGKVTKVLPGMQSAFVNIGLEKDAFLYVSDFVEDNDECEQVFSAVEEQMDTVMADVEVQDRPQRRERRTEKSRYRERKERSEAARTESARAVSARTESARAVSARTESARAVSARTESARAVSARTESMRTASSQIAQKKWIPGFPPENWDISAETEREVESHLEPNFFHTTSDIPVYVSSVPSVFPGESREQETVLPPRGEEAGKIGDSSTHPGQRLDDPDPMPEAPHLESASIKDDGETLPFAEETTKTGAVRRRSAATRRKRYATSRQSRRNETQSIDDVLHEGQEVLVQVAKEPIGKKGARVTSHIALPGRYLVYMPTVDHVGVSRKISSDSERIRLKDIILKHRNRFPGGVIVRTAAEEHSESDLVDDLKFLVRLWEEMRNRADKTSAPALIHAEMNLVQRLLRDHFSFEFAAIWVDDEMEYQKIVEFVDKIYPNLVHRIKLHTKENGIFDEYGIAPEIDKLLQPKIWLKSGGYIVINQTEALVSIDINTGKFVGRGNSLEETITRTNLEAVKEIVRQVRLRDLGGIIVIDFIDMDERKNRKRVMEALSEEIARDKSPSKILEFNEFGLVAITRKRVKQSLERTLCQPCPYCTGSGMVKSIATTCYSIYHEIEKMRNYLDERSDLMIRAHPDVARALRESESVVIKEIRNVLNKDVMIKSDPSLHIEHFNIVT